MIEIRDLLLFLSLHHQGQWKDVYADIKAKKKYPEEDMRKAYDDLQSSFVTLCDKEYPEEFKNCFNPPFLLYYYGNLNLVHARYRMTCIGTRHPNVYQNDMTYRLIQETEQRLDHQLVIVSGMALGLDSAALRAAMDSDSPIIAIIGSGIDNPYPAVNQDIYEYCKSGKGLVLSEYPGKQKARKENFVFRNRLLAALSPVVFVGGGKSRSGTSSTIRYAMDLGKEILALPCNITGDDLTNLLIKEGCSPVLSAVDMEEAIRPNVLYPKKE